MVSRRRMDERDHARRAPHRQPKRRILVVCEGELTEPAYLRAFQHDVRNPLVHIEVAPEHGDPQTAVEIAIRMREQAAEDARRQRDDNLRWDEVWATRTRGAERRPSTARLTATAGQGVTPPQASTG